MKTTIIMTDSSSDLPLSFVEENKIPYVRLTYHLKGQDYQDDFGKSMNYRDFYSTVREGEMPSTSQVNVQTYVDEFSRHAEIGNPLIYIGFSSGLSGSLQSALVARNMVLEKYKDADITVIDGKSASLGQGLLVYYACDMLKKGRTKEEIVNWLEENKLKVNHLFTVDSLDHLKRGGRISGAAAMIGSILNIKPILYVNNEGKLEAVTKVQGRRKSIRTLADMLGQKIAAPEEQIIAISHGDCLDDALYLQKLLTDNYKLDKYIINHVGPVIGSHSGPGTLALFFLGSAR